MGSGATIMRIELTTELPEYWSLLAAYKPQLLLRLVEEFAGEDNVSPVDVFGREDALSEGISPQQREKAFSNCMLGRGTSPYNDGRRAICCMRQQSNTLAAAAALATLACTPHTILDGVDGRVRAPNCSEATSFFEIGFAQLGRASDPLLLERLGRLAFEGRVVGFASPPGIYMGKIQPGRLIAPDGSELPEESFCFSRGRLGEDGEGRFQRLTFELPDDADFAMADVRDAATGRPLRYGGELADLVPISVFFQATEPDTVIDIPDPVVVEGAATPNCEEFEALYANFERAGS
ncbi:MAG: hypothetical protein H0W90_08860 [Actinobacteria bacterium]|nr:hypothetical protein [Actinomycetota bacterium]